MDNLQYIPNGRYPLERETIKNGSYEYYFIIHSSFIILTEVLYYNINHLPEKVNFFISYNEFHGEICWLKNFSLSSILGRQPCQNSKLSHVQHLISFAFIFFR